jgi:hypothetical protein
MRFASSNQCSVPKTGTDTPLTEALHRADNYRICVLPVQHPPNKHTAALCARIYITGGADVGELGRARGPRTGRAGRTGRAIHGGGTGARSSRDARTGEPSDSGVTGTFGCFVLRERRPNVAACETRLERRFACAAAAASSSSAPKGCRRNAGWSAGAEVTTMLVVRELGGLRDGRIVRGLGAAGVRRPRERRRERGGVIIAGETIECARAAASSPGGGVLWRARMSGVNVISRAGSGRCGAMSTTSCGRGAARLGGGASPSGFARSQRSTNCICDGRILPDRGTSSVPAVGGGATSGGGGGRPAGTGEATRRTAVCTTAVWRLSLSLSYWEMLDRIVAASLRGSGSDSSLCGMLGSSFEARDKGRGIIMGGIWTEGIVLIGGIVFAGGFKA